MAVVCYFEPDTAIRQVYFSCENENCDRSTRKYIVPSGPGDISKAKEIGYKLYKLDKCPKHSIWLGTEHLFRHPAFMAAMRYKDMPVVNGGVLDQPVNFGHFVHHARNEYEWFQHLVAQRRVKSNA